MRMLKAAFLLVCETEPACAACGLMAANDLSGMTPWPRSALSIWVLEI